MKEFDFIESLVSTMDVEQCGIGDDAAIIDDKYLLSKDIVTEGIHFLPTTPIEYVVNKLFNANVSDIAAMGGEAIWVILGISAPMSFDLKSLLGPIKYNCSKYRLKLIGGDTTGSIKNLTLSLTIIGMRGKNLLTRYNAKDTDIVYLSREVGNAKLSLNKELKLNNLDIESYIHYNLNAERELGKFLGNFSGVTSCIDISDGLGRDASHISRLSKVKLVINNLDFGLDIDIDTIITSGEEYALLFTVDKKVADSLEKNIKVKLKREIKKIGYVESGSGIYLLSNNRLVDISNKGYEHFSF